MVQFNDWCDFADTPIGNHNVKVITSRPADIFTGINVTAAVVPGHYAAEERVARALARLGKTEAAQIVLEDVAADLSKITVRRSITQSMTFKVPKTNKERTVLLFPPARDALKVPVADAGTRQAADLTVALNRHESHTDRVRVLLSPKTQARRKVVNDYFIPSSWNSKWSNLVRRAEIHLRLLESHCAGQSGLYRQSDGTQGLFHARDRLWRWIDTESSRELQRIWEGMQKMAQITPKLHQSSNAEFITI